MNKINFDLERQKVDYKWDVVVLINILFIIVYIIYFCCSNEKNDTYHNRVISEITESSTEKKLREEIEDENKKLKEKIDELNKDKILVLASNRDSSTKNNNLDKKSEEIITTENENVSLIKEKENLEKKIVI